MAISGSQQAYKQARSGIARSGASRSGYVFPLFAVVTVNGVNLTGAILNPTLHVAIALNEEPDTASFDVMVTTSALQAAVVVGADVLIGLGGATESPLFGGRILTTRTTRGPGRTPSVVSVMCADYLQALESEYFVTYDWPAQSATATILDLLARFANKGGVAISGARVAPGLPSHGAFGVINERIATVLRRLVTMFPGGGGFYVDPLRVLHVWEGISEPGLVNPHPLTLANPTLKGFAETRDGSQVRDAVLVEGRRTKAPIGTPATTEAVLGGNMSFPVLDASILDPVKLVDGGATLREIRVGTQRLQIAIADGIWSAPAGTPQVTAVTADVPFDAAGAGPVSIPVASGDLLTGRNIPWIRIDHQYLQVIGLDAGPTIVVPRTGFGALIGPIKAGAAVTVVDTITSMQVTDRYNHGATRELVRSQPIDSDVVMTVRSTSGPGITEQLVQDGRYSRAGATARGQREVLDFRSPLVAIDFETDDLHALPGRLQTYNFTDPGLAPTTGEFMILSADLTWPVWGQPPRRTCHGATVRVASVLDTWLPDER